MKIKSLWLAPIFLGLLTLPGCTKKGEDSNVLSFWNGFSGPDGKTMKAIVDQFDKEHPDNQFEMQIIPWSTYYDKTTLSLAFGGAPDVFVLQAARLPFYANSGALEPMDEYIKDSGLDVNDFMPKAWAKAKFKDHQYAIPLDCHPETLYYNKKLFKEAGIDHPPTTYDEFVADAHKLTKRDSNGNVTQWGYEFANLFDQCEQFMNQFGGAILDSSGTKATMMDPASLEGMELMNKLINVEKIAPNPEGQNAWDAFKIGKVAMVEEGIYMVADLQAQKSLDFGAAPVPQLGKVKALWASSHMLCMPSNLTPERKKRAFQLIKYLSDHSLQWAVAGQCPIRKSLLADPAFKNLPSQYAASAQLGYITYEPLTLDPSEVTAFAGPAFEQVLMTGMPATEAFSVADKRIDAALAR